jgi:DNA-binding GntR family transcriptional regulator
MTETITEYIKRDLCFRLASEGEFLDRLTLAALAKHYKVSLMPIRLAVRELIAEGVLLKETNGRLKVNLAVVGVRTSAFAPPAPPETLEAVLTQEVINRSLRGEASYLREETTAQRYLVGRTALRQVLNRLARKGLVEHLPRRGWHVRAFDRDDLRAYLTVRESLELTALRLARPHLVREDLEDMLRGNVPGDLEGEARLDNRLHQYIIEKSGNGYIKDFFDRHGRYFTTLFDYAAPEARLTVAMVRQHRAILRALIARDWPLARLELARHIRAQLPILRRLLKRVARPRTAPEAE